MSKKFTAPLKDQLSLFAAEPSSVEVFADDSCVIYRDAHCVMAQDTSGNLIVFTRPHADKIDHIHVAVQDEREEHSNFFFTKAGLAGFMRAATSLIS